VGGIFSYSLFVESGNEKQKEIKKEDMNGKKRKEKVKNTHFSSNDQFTFNTSPL
jgi:hypothetical protein